MTSTPRRSSCGRRQRVLGEAGRQAAVVDERQLRVRVREDVVDGASRLGVSRTGAASVLRAVTAARPPCGSGGEGMGILGSIGWTCATVDSRMVGGRAMNARPRRGEGPSDARPGAEGRCQPPRPALRRARRSHRHQRTACQSLSGKGVAARQDTGSWRREGEGPAAHYRAPVKNLTRDEARQRAALLAVESYTSCWT
jgi:hypothetical protein